VVTRGEWIAVYISLVRAVVALAQNASLRMQMARPRRLLLGLLFKSVAICRISFVLTLYARSGGYPL